MHLPLRPQEGAIQICEEGAPCATASARLTTGGLRHGKPQQTESAGVENPDLRDLQAGDYHHCLTSWTDIRARQTTLL